MSGRVLSRMLSEAELPCIPNARHPRVERLDPQNKYEELAEEYIKTRDDFEQMKRDTYLREYYLDLTDMEDAIKEAEDYKLARENLKNEQAQGTPVAVLVRAADKLVAEKYGLYAHGMACTPILRMLDENPSEIMAGLNRMLEYWATDVGDDEYEDFRVPEFILRNADRFSKEIGNLDLSVDGGKLVQVSGTLLYLSDPVEIEFVRMAYICQECSQYTVTGGEKPAECEQCSSKKLKFDPDSEQTITRNFQEAILQENVEDLAGSAASVRLRFFGNCINQFVPGDRIGASGLVRTVRIPMKTTLSYLIEVLSASKSDEKSISITEKDRDEIMEMSKDPDVLDRLSGILAPEIIGREAEKKAMILQAVSGIERKRSSFTERGRIHILFAGDPGKGKSQLLVSQKVLSERSYYISDTSKAGITAAVADIGNKRVMVPGILVLANNGVACIDELDKMQKEDREGLHTSMEQGIISKSKAGIRAIFRANTSILAAANPVYGRFDLNSDIPDQLKIEPTLMDRFDLVFWFMSSESMSQEKEIAEALRILNPPTAEDTSILGKYVKLASQNVPNHTPDSMDAIAKAWSMLKKKSSNPESIGVRHLQAIRRISEASAKIRFSPVVERVDVDLASRLMMHSWSPLGGDVDKMLGFGKSTSGAMKFIISYLRKKEQGASLEELHSWAESEGFKTPDIQNALSVLKREGQIYELRNEMFRVVA